MTTDIEFHFWPTPNGWKVAIALEEMGLPYTLRLVDIGQGAQFAPEFLEVSPNNKIPAILDPDGPDGAPVSVFESGAILLYLARKTGQFQGRNAREQLLVEQWLMWQMGGLGPMAGQAHHFLKYAPTFDPPQVLPYAQDRFRNECRRLYGVLDRRLADAPYLAGEVFTIADIATWPWVSRWQRHEQVLDDTPHVKRWFETVGARDGVQRGFALAADNETRIDRDRGAQDVLFKPR